MDFRKATQSDALRLAEANRELILDEWSEPDVGPPSVSWLESRMQRWLSDDEYEIIVFVENGLDVGYAMFTLDKYSAYVRQFYVFAEHRRFGYGKDALELLLQQIIPRDVRITLDVLAANETGHDFWRSVGFHDYSVRMELTPDTRISNENAILEAVGRG